MSDSGKCKRNRRNRGNRRKNKNKEAAGPVTESENIFEQAEVSGQLANNVGENSQISDNKNELDRNAVENKSQNKTQTTDLDEHQKGSPELINKSEVSNKSNNIDADIDYEIVSSYETLSAIKLAKYQVEFPQLAPICKEKKKLKNNKSKSLDNDDDLTLNIVDITEIDVKSDDDKLAESNAIISEAESDVEWEVADDLLQVNKQCGQKIKGQLSVETIPLQKADSEEVNSLSPEEEINLRNFLQTLNLSTNEQKIPEVPDIVVKEHTDEKESESDVNTRRARKKAALEEHFLPQIVNPRFLDVIDEEGSNESSDTTRRQSFLSENRELQQRYDDLDDDVFITEKKAKEPKDIFPKNKDYFACKKELKRQQECLLVGAKILESEVEEGCGDWTIEKTEEQRGADIVFLDDSSSSASEIDNGGETDFMNEDERVTIKTPTIEIDSFYSNNESKIPTFSRFNTEKLTTNVALNGDIGHGVPKHENMNTINSIPSTCLPTEILSNNEEISESLESLLVLPPIPAACNEVTIMANEFVDELPIVTELLNEKSFMIKNDDNIHNDVDKLHQAIEIELNTSNVSGEDMSDHSSKDYSRHDSSSSVCSSHSTSQSTAKYNPLSSSLTDIAAIVHDDLLNVHESHETGVKDNYTASSFSITKTNRFINVPGLEDSSNTQSLQRMDNPTPLKTLCLNKVASLPYGESIIEELASTSESLKHLTQNVRSENWKEVLPTTMPFYPLPDISAIKKAALLQHQTSKPLITCQVEKVPPPINPRQSSFKVLRDDPPWVGLASHTDPTLLACLSPSQKSQIERSKNTANDEAGELIDMHCKYAERRGYHETNAKAEKSAPVSIIIDDNIPVQASGGDGRAASSPGSTNRLLAIIRDPTLNPDAKQSPASPDHQNSPQSTFDFMETLRSFEDLNKKLAKEEKNISVTKKSGNSNETLEISESYTSNQSYKANIKKDVPTDSNYALKNMKFSDFPPINHRTSSKDEKYTVNKYNNIDISDHSSKIVNQTKYRYNSTGNLNSHLEDTSNQIQRFHNKRAFLLDDPIFEIFSDKVKSSKVSTTSLQNGVPKRRSSLPKEIHDRQIAYIVQKEKEIEEQIRQLENQKRMTNFDNHKTSSGPRAPMMKDDEFPAEKYNISRQRDIAIIQQEMEEQFESSVTKSDRPIPIISTPSNGEKFRDQMYSEYLDKVAEREERKHHKVIKISNSQDNLSNINILNDLKKNCNKIEEEFISKAKMRWDKLGFKDPETEDENEIEVTKTSVKDKVAAAEKHPVVIEHKIKVIEGDEEKDVQKLPNHLQEFVKFTSSGNEAGECSEDIPVPSSNPPFILTVAFGVALFIIAKCFLFGRKH